MMTMMVMMVRWQLLLMIITISRNASFICNPARGRQSKLSISILSTNKKQDVIICPRKAISYLSHCEANKKKNDDTRGRSDTRERNPPGRIFLHHLPGKGMGIRDTNKELVHHAVDCRLFQVGGAVRARTADAQTDGPLTYL